MMMMMMKLDTPFMINNPGGTISKFVCGSPRLGDISIRR